VQDFIGDQFTEHWQDEFRGSSQMRVYSGSEASGLEEGSGDVVGEVPEAEGGPPEVLEPAVDV
jgi:hypothetical protein